jgi:hypothetical protein
MGQSLEKIPFGGAVDSIVAAEGMNQQLIHAEFMSWVAGDYYTFTSAFHRLINNPMFYQPR